MSYQRIKLFILSLGCCLIPLNATGTTLFYPQDQRLYDQYPWSVMYYYGQTVSASLFSIFEANWQHWPEHIQSIEIAHTFDEQNFLRLFFKPLVGVLQLAGNFTIRNGDNENRIYEFEPYLIFRWANFPWNHCVNTSFALAEGVSYDSSVPAIEKRQNNHTKRLLNYLIVEGTFASPNYPRVQLLARIHHRSGAYGLYHAGNTGSNVIGIGLRYLFN